MKLYACIVIAAIEKPGRTAVEGKPSACLAVDNEQAIGIAYTDALGIMPEELGYYSHSVAVVEIPAEMIALAQTVEVAANV